MPPNLLAALGLGLRAAVREAWLVPVGALLAGLRRAALWPAAAVLGAVLARAALADVAEHPLDPLAPLRGGLIAIGSPRALPLVLGLAVAGLLAGAALRVAWLSGALPTLGGALAGPDRPTPRFAAGIAYGLPRVLAAALLGLVAEVGATGFAGALVVAILRLLGGASAAAPARPVALAAASALALTLALAAPLVAFILAEAAVARAAVRAEPPGRAFAGAVRAFLARPGAFVLAGLAFGAAATLAPLSVEGVGTAVLGFAQDVPSALLAGPNLMLAALALGASAAVDVWWLGTVAALSCGDGPGRG